MCLKLNLTLLYEWSLIEWNAFFERFQIALQVVFKILYTTSQIPPPPPPQKKKWTKETTAAIVFIITNISLLYFIIGEKT